MDTLNPFSGKGSLSRREGKPFDSLIRAITGASFVIPAVFYFAFLNGVAESISVIWTRSVLSVSIFFFVISIIIKSRIVGAGSYFMLGLAVASMAGSEGLMWLRMAYPPYIFIGALVFGGWGALGFSLAVPLLEARRLMPGPGVEDWVLLALCALAGGAGYIALSRREREVRHRRPGRSSHLQRVEPVMPDGSEQYDASSPVNMDGLMREEDESLRELLRIAVFATRASGVSLFVLAGDKLRLRCTSAPQSPDGGLISPVPMWYINDARRMRHTLVTGNLGAETTEGFINRAAPLEENLGAGGQGHGDAASVAAVPVIVGNTLTGVLAVNSSRSNAFRGNTVTVLELISAQVSRTLSGGRVVEETERNLDHLSLVLDESKKLAASIDLKEITGIVADAMAKLSEMDVHIYLKKPSGFSLIRQSGNPHTKEVRVEFDGTLAEMALAEGEKWYISSLAGYSKPLLPDQGGEVYGSAFLLPMISHDEEVIGKKSIMGLIALTSDQKDTLKAETITKLDMVGIQAAISLKNSMTHKATQVRAATDALTGLSNRRSFMDLLEAEHMRFERTGMKYAIIMMDVDFFKKVNDTYGHQAGDEVLKEVASLMRESFRATDYLGRYGGEEFAAVLVNSDRSGAHRLAERMRHATEIKRMDTSAGAFSVTMSLGIAIVEEGMEPEDVIKRADEALYRAKESGRNRTEFWG